MWRIAAAAIAAGAGCYQPSFADCASACAADGDCAPGQTCTAAGLCAAPGQAAACEAPIDAPVDAPLSPVGTYAMLFTNQENGCMFGGWMAGQTSTVEVEIRVHDAVYTAEPRGPVAAFLDAWLGSHVFAGSLTGASVALVLAGNKQAMRGMCKYTFDASFRAVQVGDTLTGDLLFQARTNGAADCGVLSDCTTRQSVSGARGM